MVAPLITALTRRGVAALNGTTETLTAAGPGTLTQSVDTPTTPPSLRAAAKAFQSKRPTLIASAKRNLAAAGRATLRLRTTSAGRRAIRRAESLKLAIVTTFAPRTGAPVVSSIASPPSAARPRVGYHVRTRDRRLGLSAPATPTQ